MINVHDDITAADQTIRALERLLIPVVPEKRWHAWGPTPAPDFLRWLRVLGQPGSRRLLEVGCGPGTNLYLARMVGWEHLSGVEREHGYWKIATRLCPWAVIHLVDALHFHQYAFYDVIHLGRIAIADSDQQEIELLVMGQMKHGAVGWFALNGEVTADGD